MNKPKTENTIGRISPFTSLAAGVFHALKVLSPMKWLEWLSPFLKSRSELADTELSKDFTRNRAKCVDYYVAGWLFVEALLVLIVCATRPPELLRAAIAVAAGLRILEIVQVAINVTVFDRLSGRPDNRVASTARLLVMSFVNFAELLVCFGVIYATDYSHLRGAGQPVTAFYFSIITQVTIGYGDVYPTGWLRIIAALQAMVGFVFAVLVFGRYVGTLPRIEGILDEPNAGQEVPNPPTGKSGDAPKP